MRPGVHPALQLACPAFWTGSIRHYGILGNNRRKRAIEAARTIFQRRRRTVELVKAPTLNDLSTNRILHSLFTSLSHFASMDVVL